MPRLAEAFEERAIHLAFVLHGPRCIQGGIRELEMRTAHHSRLHGGVQWMCRPPHNNGVALELDPPR
jgi:hypothetical protein